MKLPARSREKLAWFLWLAIDVLAFVAGVGVVALVACFMFGCSTAAHTEVDPASSSVKSKTVERRPTETTKVSITTAPEKVSTYRLRVVKKGSSPCDSVSSPVYSQPVPLPEAK